MELRDVPHVGHGALTGLGDPDRSPEQTQESDGQAQSLFAKLGDAVVTVELFADDRELGERGMNHAMLQRGVVTEEQSEQSEEDQQQWEDREDAVVGEQGRQRGAAVFDVFLGDADDEGGRRMTLLEGVETTNEFLD